MDNGRDLAAIILGAGQGKRMKSQLPKVIHTLCGKPMISWVIDAVEEIGVKDIVVVVGYRADMVRRVVQDRAVCAFQSQQLGTGHAVMQAEPLLKDHEGDLLILYGDTPLLTPRTLKRFIAFHRNEDDSATVLTALLSAPTGYGRIIRDEDGRLLRIVEERDATPREKEICEINTGILSVKAEDLFSALSKVTCQNAQGEYYLTDIIGILRGEGKTVGAFLIDRPDEALGVNTPEELSHAETIMRERLIMDV